jgi:hypothetical protein
MPRQDLPFANPVPRWFLDWERTVLILRDSEKKKLKLTQNEKENFIHINDHVFNCFYKL